MPSILIARPNDVLTNLFAAALRTQLAAEVRVARTPSEVALATSTGRHDALLVDSEFGNLAFHALDVLAAAHVAAPSMALGVCVGTPDAAARLTRDAIEILPVAVTVSRQAPLAEQIGRVRELTTHGRTRQWTGRPEWHRPERAPGQFAKLVRSDHDARMWRDIAQAGPHGDRAGPTDVLWAYHRDMAAALAVHHVDEGDLAATYAFAWRCRSFLAPYIAT